MSNELLIWIIKLILLIGILLYIILVSVLILTSVRRKLYVANPLVRYPLISIIVPFRNESQNLPILLQSLQNQSYPREKFDIIFVDDHSSDEGLSILSQFAKQHENVHCISLPASLEGKKSALRIALNITAAELIVTTDADCRMGPEWLSTIASFQQATEASLIIAPVAYLYTDSIFEKLQAVEFSSLIASGAATAHLERPIMCNGANLAFLRSVYPLEENELIPGSPSGDDIFLLLHLKKTMSKRIKFLNSPDAIVYTLPSTTLSAFINQRKRWFSKSSHYKDPEILGTGFIVAYSNVSLLLYLFLAIVNPSEWIIFLPVVIVKLLADATFLFPFLSFIKARKLIWLVPLLEIIYPAYILYIIISSKFSNYSWKGRIFRKRSTII